jgi:hypothetical protein
MAAALVSFITPPTALASRRHDDLAGRYFYPQMPQIAQMRR